MATIREYFDTDAKVLTMHRAWTLGTQDGVALAEVIAKIAYDFEANAKYSTPTWGQPCFARNGDYPFRLR